MKRSNVIKKFCDENPEESLIIGVVGLACTLVLVGTIFTQAKQLSSIRAINAYNHKEYLKLLGENAFLGRIINKIL